MAYLNPQGFDAYSQKNQREKTIFFGLYVIIFCLVSAMLITTGLVWAEPLQVPLSVDSKRIEGRWVRPDGGYILQLQDAKEDGGLTATYFNPRPINVALAETRRKEGVLSLFVELRDVNYPGSTYTLEYDPADDRLKGHYFQATLQQTFEVEFARVNGAD